MVVIKYQADDDDEANKLYLYTFTQYTPFKNILKILVLKYLH